MGIRRIVDQNLILYICRKANLRTGQVIMPR